MNNGEDNNNLNEENTNLASFAVTPARPVIVSQPTTAPGAPPRLPRVRPSDSRQRNNGEPRLSMALPPALTLNPITNLNPVDFNSLLEPRCKPADFSRGNRRHDNHDGRPFGGSGMSCC